MFNPGGKEKAIFIVDLTITVAEVIIAIFLIAILFYSIWYFVFDLFTTFSRHTFSVEAVRLLIDKVLLLFLIIELYKITISYLTMKSVVNEVFIAGFVALGRKILIYDYDKWGLRGAIALSILMLTLSAGYFLLAMRKKGEERK